jgi:phosphoglycolate phosphatase
MGHAPRLRAVLFDFDHTLAHLGDFVRWTDARTELLPLYLAAGVPQDYLETHPGALGVYGDIAAAGLLPPLELDEVQRRASAIITRYEAEAIPDTHVLSEAIEALQALRGLGLQAGIVTSNAKEVAAAIVERDGLAEAVGTFIGGDQVSQLKPSPQGLLLCSNVMGLSPGECVYVGDAVGDMEAAQAAGVPGVGVRTGHGSEAELIAAGAGTVLDSIADLPALLKRDFLSTGL